MARSAQGLAVTRRIAVRRERLLPVAGEVLVEVGQRVEMGDAVARALEPGPLLPLNAASALGVPPKELAKAMVVGEGERIAEGQLLAETSSLFGLLRGRVVSPLTGTVESISGTTGHLMLRGEATPIEVIAYLPGEVVAAREGSGVEIEAEITLVQGIFGVGGEALGRVALLDQPGGGEPQEGSIAISRGVITAAELERLRARGVRGVVAASIPGEDLVAFAGRDLNPASTGSEELGLTVVLTEGFGDLPMARETHALLAALDGKPAALNGTTQIRAGVKRPELVAAPLVERAETTLPESRIGVGSDVRIVRGAAFGEEGRVVSIPPHPRELATGAKALVFEVELGRGDSFAVPRTNVELVTR